ncbi:ATP-binding protein [Novosphingobium sp.]|uniref:ATP-binding protein n=1 Tax=Novosphingobium sp. TaxID=1874826 RepID=UPI003FA57C2F
MSVSDRIRQSLLALHMARALETLDHTLARLEKGEISAIEAIDDLLAEELNLREGRRIGVALRTARLMPVKTLESFDFSFQPSLDRHRITALAQLEFINRAEVLHFLGPPGTGKSHLATAIGVAAVKAGRSVYRCSLAELIEALTKAEREGRLVEKIRFYTRASLLIVDEIGYLPITPGGANLFFQLVNARYEKGAMILTSNPFQSRNRRDSPQGRLTHDRAAADEKQSPEGHDASIARGHDLPGLTDLTAARPVRRSTCPLLPVLLVAPWHDAPGRGPVPRYVERVHGTPASDCADGSGHAA